MALSLRRAPRLPADVRAAVGLGPGERVLTWAPVLVGAGPGVAGEPSGTTLVATNHALYAVGAAGEPTLTRPWHEVDSGSWSAELTQLTVTWIDGTRPSQWVLGDTTLLPETLRERVQASVVLTQKIELGPRRTARAVIRQDLGRGGLVEQVVLGRGVRADDPEVAAATAAALAYLREQVGLS
ncbi:hypothetical protein [Phycicoccus sp. Root101]|uniref:hypothetical protein n=1 Tax=Phycicoccus sp. Root101 TaxID=1736421 RepID=UPI000702B049|nr:hypothetical protein [Phycicoccus sp. Root101]KQU66337.1 hypothetical protein ASC58_14880 [Phycicoccus sp. Root101]